MRLVLGILLHRNSVVWFCDARGGVVAAVADAHDYGMIVIDVGGMGMSRVRLSHPVLEHLTDNPAYILQSVSHPKFKIRNTEPERKILLCF